MLPTKIVVIGAGSAEFGLNTIAALLDSRPLRGSRVALVDRDAGALARMARLAERLSREWDAALTFTSHTRHAAALDGAEFVVSAIEVPPREALWRSDYEIPLKYGVRQPYAENGGPGGFAHAARNIGPVMQIVRDMERLCPDAWFLNFSNPMIRICDAIHRYSRIKVVGLCHQIYAGYGMAGLALAGDFGFEVPVGHIDTHAGQDTWARLMHLARQARQRIQITAAGLNHFTWMLDARDRHTGEDLYPLFAERWDALDPAFEPLTRRVYRAFGRFPMPGDEHLCEYLPWLTDPTTQPWNKYEISLYDWEAADRRRQARHADIARMGAGQLATGHLRAVESEGAVELIESLAGAGDRDHLAVNVPNRGSIANLPPEAIVEIPARITRDGICGVEVGPLPVGIAELCRRETTVAQLCVDSAVSGDRRAALQCLLLDPVIADFETAELILDDYLLTYREYLPQYREPGAGG